MKKKRNHKALAGGEGKKKPRQKVIIAKKILVRKPTMTPDEMIISKILFIRGKGVMLDRDIAEIYGTTTFRLNEAVKRNRQRFPKDFMFKLTQEEKNNLIEDHERLQTLKFSPATPYAFTEHGAVMLASVLNSPKAIQANIRITRIFNKTRKMLRNYKDLIGRIETLELKTLHNAHDIETAFEQIKQIIISAANADRPRIGFRRKDDND